MYNYQAYMLKYLKSLYPSEYCESYKQYFENNPLPKLVIDYKSIFREPWERNGLLVIETPQKNKPNKNGDVFLEGAYLDCDRAIDTSLIDTCLSLRNKCPDCKGSGKIALFVSSVVCEKCEGKGVI